MRGIVVGLGVLSALTSSVLPSPPSSPPSSPAAPSPAASGDRVQRQDVRVDVRADARVHVTETITFAVAVAGRRPEFVRTVVRRRPLDAAHDAALTVTHVRARSSSGRTARVQVTTGAALTSLRFTSPPPGTGSSWTTVLEYDVQGLALGDDVIWDATGQWPSVPVEAASVTVAAPRPSVSEACEQGVDEVRRPCPATPAPGGTVFTSAGALAPGESLRVTARFPAGTVAPVRPRLVERTTPAEALRLTPARVATALGAFAVLVAGPVVGAVRARRRRGPPPDPEGTIAGVMLGLVGGFIALIGLGFAGWGVVGVGILLSVPVRVAAYLLARRWTPSS